MPVPKRKTSKSRRDRRSSTKFIRHQAISKCPNCEEPLRPHQACLECGFYKGKKVLATKVDRQLKRGEARAKAKSAESNAPDGTGTESER